MKKETLAVLLIFCMVLAGCGGPGIIVTHYPPTQGNVNPGEAGISLDGVPFYTKAIACKQETVWVEQTYKLTLTGTRKDSGRDITAVSRSMEITQNGYTSEEFKNLKKLIDQHTSAGVEEVLAGFEALREKSEYRLPVINKKFDFSAPTPAHSFILVSNKTEPDSYVDYTDRHYINVKKPWSGSVNPNITLNSDLLLTNANIHIQDNTLETFLNVLPIKEVLSAAMPSRALTKTKEASPVVIINLEIEPQTYIYTLSKTAKAPGLPCVNSDVLHTIEGASFSRSQMSAEGSKKKDAGGDTGNTLKFSGSIDLPNKK
jgi:hypothetical protein